MKITYPMRFLGSLGRSPVAVAALLLLVSQAQARIGGTPLSLSLNQTFIHDSNVERREEGVSDTLSSTSVSAGLDKDYGRQNYKADVSASVNKYQKLDQYDNNGIDINLSFSSEIGAASKVFVSHARTRSLQDFDVQGTDIRRKEVTTDTTTTLSGQYGLAKQWMLVGNLDFGKIDYTSTTVNGRTSVGRRIGVRFTPSDLLYFEMGFRDANYDYPNAEIFSSGLTITGDEIGRSDLSFQTGWTVTGYSKLFAQVNWTSEKHAVTGTGRDFDGLTGSLTWQFTPRGKVGYTLNFSRDTNNSGGSTAFSRTSVRDQVSNNLGGTAFWRLTSKFNVNGGADFLYLKEYEQQISGSITAQDSATSLRRQLRIGATYSPDRSLLFACGLTQIRRTLSLFSNGYLSNATNCSATFSME